jgi:SAM-dependent methyltransferase
MFFFARRARGCHMAQAPSDASAIRPADYPVVDPYAGGAYFADATRHQADASFKADEFLKLFVRVMSPASFPIRSYADVGTGSGHAAQLIGKGLKGAGYPLECVRGYDISPHARELALDGVEYLHGDFAQAGHQVDLVTMLDVFEHVPDAITFLKNVAARCKVIGFHVPLDNSMNAAMRDLFHSKLRDPGHLLFMDGVFALNLLSLSGLKVIDYAYTFSFRAPSGHCGVLSRLLYPARAMAARVSPWLLSKTLGGASLMVVAMTPAGVRTLGRS